MRNLLKARLNDDAPQIHKLWSLWVAAFWGAMVGLAGMWVFLIGALPLWLYLVGGLLIPASIAVARVLKQPGIS